MTKMNVMKEVMWTFLQVKRTKEREMTASKQKLLRSNLYLYLPSGGPSDKVRGRASAWTLMA